MASTAILLIILACILPLPPISPEELDAILGPDLDGGRGAQVARHGPQA